MNLHTVTEEKRGEWGEGKEKLWSVLQSMVSAERDWWELPEPIIAAGDYQGAISIEVHSAHRVWMGW
jgi:hypothetical protein